MSELPPSAPPPESTRGAWYGLVLMALGACSVLTATVEASTAHLARVALEAASITSRRQEVEGVVVRGLHDTLLDAVARYDGLVAWIYADAAICGVLGLALLITAFGICRRSSLGLTSTRFVLVTKAAYLIVAGLYVRATLLAPLRELLTLLADLSDQLEELAYQSGADGAAFARLETLLSEELGSGVTYAVATVAAAQLVALLLAFGPATRAWCRRPTA